MDPENVQAKHEVRIALLVPEIIAAMYKLAQSLDTPFKVIQASKVVTDLK